MYTRGSIASLSTLFKVLTRTLGGSLPHCVNGTWESHIIILKWMYLYTKQGARYMESIEGVVWHRKQRTAGSGLARYAREVAVLFKQILQSDFIECLSWIEFNNWEWSSCLVSRRRKRQLILTQFWKEMMQWLSGSSRSLHRTMLQTQNCCARSEESWIQWLASVHLNGWFGPN